jgi:actin-related protein
MDRVPLVCDYGSAFSKVGYAGTEAPLDVFPTILGKLRHDVSDVDCPPLGGLGSPQAGVDMHLHHGTPGW